MENDPEIQYIYLLFRNIVVLDYRDFSMKWENSLAFDCGCEVNEKIIDPGPYIL